MARQVILSQISNAILANNQRRLFAKLMNESVGVLLGAALLGISGAADLGRLFGHRRCSACWSTRSAAIMLTADRAGRRSCWLQDPWLWLIGLGFAVAPPAMLILRKLVKRIKGLASQPVHRHRRHSGNHAGIAAGHPHRQGVHAGTDHARSASTPSISGGRIQRQQDGAGFQPFQPADGNAGRLSQSLAA